MDCNTLIMPKRYILLYCTVCIAGLIDDSLGRGEGHLKNLPLFGGFMEKKFYDWGGVMEFFNDSSNDG